jgi:hypothetical protein
MRRQNTAGKPFFLYLPFSMGQIPNLPSSEFKGKSRVGNEVDPEPVFATSAVRAENAGKPPWRNAIDTLPVHFALKAQPASSTLNWRQHGCGQG